MSSEAQINANRQNATRSTGPRTPEGKAISARNGVTHGLHSKHFVLLPGENAEEFAALHENYDREFLPATPAERHHVREITESHWCLARVGRFETNYLTGCDSPDINVLLKWDRLTNSARRAYRNAIRDINELRDKRGNLAISPDPRIDLPPWPKPVAPEICRTEPTSAPETAPTSAGTAPNPQICEHELPVAPESALPSAATKKCRTEPNFTPEPVPASPGTVPNPQICENEPPPCPKSALPSAATKNCRTGPNSAPETAPTSSGTVPKPQICEDEPPAAPESALPSAATKNCRTEPNSAPPKPSGDSRGP